MSGGVPVRRAPRFAAAIIALGDGPLNGAERLPSLAAPSRRCYNRACCFAVHARRGARGANGVAFDQGAHHLSVTCRDTMCDKIVLLSLTNGNISSYIGT
jgi:hypothetical protein